ncbi:hypothetical protein JCM18237_27780 [Halorubrum luteum]
MILPADASDIEASNSNSSSGPGSEGDISNSAVGELEALVTVIPTEQTSMSAINKGIETRMYDTRNGFI